jgi:acyl carrier protein
MSKGIRIKEIIFDQLGGPFGEINEPGDIKDEATFEELTMDSLDEIETVMEVEVEFDIELPDADIEQWKTVGDAIKYIDAL